MKNFPTDTHSNAHRYIIIFIYHILTFIIITSKSLYDDRDYIPTARLLFVIHSMACLYHLFVLFCIWTHLEHAFITLNTIFKWSLWFIPVGVTIYHSIANLLFFTSMQSLQTLNILYLLTSLTIFLIYWVPLKINQTQKHQKNIVFKKKK